MVRGGGGEKVGGLEAREASRRFLKCRPLKGALKLEIARGVHILGTFKNKPL